MSAHTKRFFESPHPDNQDYDEIRRDCFDRMKLFKDWVFRAADKSLAWEDAVANVTFRGYSLNQERVQWSGSGPRYYLRHMDGRTVTSKRQNRSANHCTYYSTNDLK